MGNLAALVLVILIVLGIIRYAKTIIVVLIIFACLYAINKHKEKIHVKSGDTPQHTQTWRGKLETDK